MRTKTKAAQERIERRKADYRSTKLYTGIKFRGDTEEMDPAELKRRLRLFERRAAAGQELFPKRRGT